MEYVLIGLAITAASLIALVVLRKIAIDIELTGRADWYRDALLVYVDAAIIGAYKASEALVDAGQERLRGVDKRAIAQGLYDALPETINVRGTPVPIGLIKAVISKKQFATWVDIMFEELNEAVDEFQVKVDPT